VETQEGQAEDEFGVGTSISLGGGEEGEDEEERAHEMNKLRAESGGTQESH
jgi:hypothetical protein